MASTKVTFKRGLKSDINSVPIKDGQLIITKDTGELYADVPLNGQIVRRLVGDGAGIVDPTYDPTSTNAQSGTAVADAFTQNLVEFTTSEIDAIWNGVFA